MVTQRYLEQLFISKVRIKALRYFLQHPGTAIHLRAAVRELNEEINAVRRELSRMEKIAFVISEQRGNRKYFTLNPDFVFYDELLGMMYKSFGIGADIIASQKKLGDLHFAVLTQGLTRNMGVGKHRVDMLLVGEGLKMPELKAIVEKEEKQLGRDLYYSVLSPNDFLVRKKRKDMFVQELFAQDIVVLVGNKASLMDGMI